MTVDVDLIENVSRLALFADLGREQLSAVLPLLQEVSYGEGEWVVRRGDTEVGLHIVVDGEVGVLLDSQELAVLKKGSFFGEISALLGEPAVADVVARSALHCLYLADAEVERFLIANPLVMLRMLQTEARRLRTTDELRT
ncbi:MAG: cyclic nucleotide-binding domain-containing protein [Actinobacteria bacterium]|nr:cyclic nucleotide-binding domain-containing protein [Actinomycetota bacterium]